jgi:regulator of sirC expression with transglutaminase-like and TPR domain
VQLAEELLASHDLRIEEVAIRISTLEYPQVSAQRIKDGITAIADRVSAIVRDRTDPDYRIRVINTVIYKEFGYWYNLNDLTAQSTESNIIGGLIATKKGSCVTMPLLYFIVTERLGYPVVAVNAPQHFFLRYDDGSYRSNIEATSGGGEMSDQQIIHDIGIPQAGVTSGAYLRSITKREYLAELVGVMAFLERHSHHVDDAVALYRLALQGYDRQCEVHSALAEILSGTVRAQYGRGPAGAKTPMFKEALKHAKACEALGAPAPAPPDYLTAKPPENPVVFDWSKRILALQGVGP